MPGFSFSSDSTQALRFRMGLKWVALGLLSLSLHLAVLGITPLLLPYARTPAREPQVLAVRLMPVVNQTIAAVALTPTLTATVHPRPVKPARPKAKPAPAVVRPAPPPPVEEPAPEPMATRTPAVPQPVDASPPAPSASAPDAATPSAATSEPTPEPSDASAQLIAAPPPSATIDFELRVTGAGLASGVYESRLEWEHKGDTYAIRLFEKNNQFLFSSEGQLKPGGLAPVRYTDKRGWRAMVATNFDYEHTAIRFSSRSDSVAMEAGAQDTLSVAMQLASFARGNVQAMQSGVALAVQVADSRRTGVWIWRAQAEETLDTRQGALRTLRLTRAPPVGSFENTVEIWLAVDHQWMPVRIKRTEAKGTIWDFVVTAIHPQV